MAKSQGDGITILLGLKGHEVERVSENEEEIKVKVRAGRNQLSPLRLNEVIPAWLMLEEEDASQLERITRLCLAPG